MPHWDGDWVVDCESDGRVELNLLYFPADNIKRRKPCRIEFTRDAENNVTPYHMAVEVKRLDAPMTALRMYRKENEAAVNSGKIYNPRCWTRCCALGKSQLAIREKPEATVSQHADISGVRARRGSGYGLVGPCAYHAWLDNRYL